MNSYSLTRIASVKAAHRRKTVFIQSVYTDSHSLILPENERKSKRQWFAFTLALSSSWKRVEFLIEDMGRGASSGDADACSIAVNQTLSQLLD